MEPTNPFADLLRRIRTGDHAAAAQLVRDFEPIVRRDLRFRLRDARVRRHFDSMDICQSVLASFFVRAAAGQYDLNAPADLAKLLLAITRNKLAERVRKQHRQRRDARRTVGEVEDVGVAAADASPSRVMAGKDLLEAVRNRLNDEERRLADLRGQGCSWDQIVESLGGTAEARRKQLTRAMDRVTRELGLDFV